jgi:hypothetical protein
VAIAKNKKIKHASGDQVVSAFAGVLWMDNSALIPLRVNLRANESFAQASQAHRTWRQKCAAGEYREDRQRVEEEPARIVHLLCKAMDVFRSAHRPLGVGEVHAQDLR